MSIHFFIPDPEAFFSGGNAYNAALISALSEKGIQVTHSEELPEDRQADFYIYDTLFMDQLEDAALKRPAILLLHHLQSLYPVSEKVFVRDEKPVLDRLDGFIVNSKFTRAYLQKNGYDRAPTVILEPACAQEKITRTQFSSKVNALILANLVPRKGVLPFLKALKKAQPPPYYAMRIVGNPEMDPAYAEACLALIRTSQNLRKTVSFLGTQDSAGIQILFRKSNLLLSSSYMETFGMAIQEAALAGLPLLVLKGGNTCNHVRDGANGYCCRSMEELADRFCQLVQKDQAFLNLQKRADAWLPEYATSWSTQAEKLTHWLTEGNWKSTQKT